MICGNTSNFIDHPLHEHFVSAHGTSHRAWAPGPPPSKSGAVSSHLRVLLQEFKRYFPSAKDPRTAKKWIRNPFNFKLGESILRNRLDVRDTLRVSLSSIIPRWERLVAAKQVKGSHWIKIVITYISCNKNLSLTIGGFLKAGPRKNLCFKPVRTAKKFADLCPKELQGSISDQTYFILV